MGLLLQHFLLSEDEFLLRETLKLTLTLSCEMLHYFHQLPTSLVCLLFGGGQVAYNGFIRAFSLKTEAPVNKAEESGKRQPQH